MAEDRYRIGEVAARTSLSLRTIRSWESAGLIKPSARSGGGFRLYTEADIARVLVLRAMKPADFSLEELLEVADLRDRLMSLPAAVRTADPAASRMRELIEEIRLRFKIQRERLAAGELALSTLRDLAPPSTWDSRPGEAGGGH